MRRFSNATGRQLQFELWASHNFSQNRIVNIRTSENRFLFREGLFSNANFEGDGGVGGDTNLVVTRLLPDCGVGILSCNCWVSRRLSKWAMSGFDRVEDSLLAVWVNCRGRRDLTGSFSCMVPSSSQWREGGLGEMSGNKFNALVTNGNINLLFVSTWHAGIGHTAFRVWI